MKAVAGVEIFSGEVVEYTAAAKPWETRYLALVVSQFMPGSRRGRPFVVQARTRGVEKDGKQLF